MKKIFTLVIAVVFIGAVTKAYAQKELLPIDSLYMQAVQPFYIHALEQVADIWPGMSLGPVCFYRIGGPALLYNHPQPPASFVEVSDGLFLGAQEEFDLFGNTVRDINGVLTAIVNYGSQNLGSLEEVFAVMFHELHHVYQRNELPDLRFDNPAMLMTYPEDVTNDALKLYEHQLLYLMGFAPDESNFRHFLNWYYSYREERAKQIGAYAEFEKAVENAEGPAVYTEYLFFHSYNHIPQAVKDNYAHKNFWSLLTNPAYGRQSLRARHMASGFALCHILDRFAGNWKDDFYGSGMDLFDFFVAVFEPDLYELPGQNPELETYLSLSQYHTNLRIAERMAQLEVFYEQPGLKLVLDFELPPHFRGFDPMNAVAIDDQTIMHKTMLNLGRGENRFFVVNKDAVSLVRDVVWNVERVIVFVPAADVDIQNDQIRVSSENLQISWRGNIVSQDDASIVFRCE